MVDMYVELVNKFPSIIALVDPLRKEVRVYVKPLNFSHFYRTDQI